MSHWNTQNSYNRPGKRQFEEINYEIECLKQQLYRNDCMLTQELDSNIFGDMDRAFLAAEMYKNRLIALNESSRSQIVLVQLAASAKNYYSESNWNAKRPRYNNFAEDKYCNNSNQYSAPNSWSGYSRYGSLNNWNNTRYNNNRNWRYRNKRKPQKKQIVPLNPNMIEVKTANTSFIKNIAPVHITGSVHNNQDKTTANKATSPVNTTAPVKVTVAPVKTTAVQVKTNFSPVIANGMVNTIPTLVTVKTNSSPAVNITAAGNTAVKRTYPGAKIMMPVKNNCPGPAIIMPAKTEMLTPKKTPSYPKGYRLQFSAADRITIKSEVPSTPSPLNRNIKVEPRGDDSMQDDLENHI